MGAEENDPTVENGRKFDTKLVQSSPGVFGIDCLLLSADVGRLLSSEDLLTCFKR